MDLFTYLMAKKSHNTHRDLFSYLLGKGAGGSGTYVNFTGTSLNISNTLRARIKNITLKGATSQYTTTGKQLFNINDLKSIPSGVTIGDDGYVTLNIVNNGSSVLYVDLPTHNLNLQNSTNYLLITEIENISQCALLSCTQWGQITAAVRKDVTGTSINAITTKATVSNDVGINTSVGIYANATGTVKFRLSVYPYSTMTVDDFVYEEYTGEQPSPSPEYPQPIKVVTGEQNITEQGKNLANISILGQVPVLSTGELTTYTNGGCTDYIEVDNTKEYVFSFLLANNTQTKQRYIMFYDENKQYLGYAQSVPNGYLLSSNNHFVNTKYVRIRIDYIPSFIWLQLEQNSIATSYKPYITINYSLSLGNIELAKIGTYQDYIYGTPNNWYKKSAITKIKLSDLTWVLRDWGYRADTDLSNIVTPSTTNIMAILLCNVYKACTPNNAYGLTGSLEHGISVYGNAILVREAIIRDLNDFNTMISSANVYLLNIEPTDTQITDTTLIEQLNNLYNATSQDGTTIITCSSASDSNEIIVFSGDIKVTSVGNSLNTSLLSSNIQEEPNLDDVNKTEDIEQNEEPIEEKVS